jgi:NAD(P)-dependent dehydrogenase (short-subunit alcohol dehydrogenase family)
MKEPAVPLVRDYPDATALIAGGTSGIGLASAIALAEAGVRRLALLARDTERGEAARAKVASAYPDAQVLFVPVDATDGSQLGAAVDTTVQRFGSLDICVCSTASSYRPELMFRMPAEDVTGTLVAMAQPPLLLTHAAMAVMRQQGGGSIINVASDAGKTATPGESALGAAMAAIIMYSRVAAIEGKRDGVRVNALTPSLVLGTATAEHVLRDGFSKKLFEKAAAQAHLGATYPEDLAALVVFLAGPGAAKLTGQAISVNGGISAA